MLHSTNEPGIKTPLVRTPGTWELIQFRSRGDSRGQLVAIEANRDIPFDIKRVYYLVGTKEGVVRGLHAHKELDQVLIAVSGRCRVRVENGISTEEFCLNEDTVGLRITRLVWRELYDFTPDCVILVLANSIYEPDDYIRDYDHFQHLVKSTI